MFSQPAKIPSNLEAVAAKHPIDWEQLHQLCDDSPEFAWELLKIFVVDSFVNLKTLKQAIVDRNYWQTEQAAHQIKGASANVGATAVSSAAAQIEQQARNQQFEAADRLLQDLEATLHQIQTLVKISG